MSKINIRNIIKSDYMSVYNLIKNSLGYDNNITDLSARLDRLIDNGYITLAAELNGVVIGFVGFLIMSAYEFEGDYIRILALASDKGYQNIGVGTALLNAVEKYATDNGVSTIALSSGTERTEAHCFYENRGYHKYGFGFKKKL